MTAYWAIFTRDLRLAARAPAAWLFGLAFFVLFTVMSSLAIGPDPADLQRAGPGVLWLALVFSILIAAQSLFAAPQDSGETAWLITEPVSLTGVTAARLAARWLVSAAPLILVSPFCALILNLESLLLPAIILALGSPAALLYASLGAAAGAGSRSTAGVLAPLIAGPLLSPVLIFGVGAIESGQVFGPEARALLAASLLAAAVCPPACAFALRAANE